MHLYGLILAGLGIALVAWVILSILPKTRKDEDDRPQLGLGIGHVPPPREEVIDKVGLSQRMHNRLVDTVLADDWETTSPDPQQIIEEVEGALPTQRELARTKYVGLRVIWDVRMAGFQPSGSKYQIQSSPVDSSDNYRISFQLNGLPLEFKTLARGTVMRILGTISRVDDSVLELEVNPRIKIFSRT